MLFRPQRLPTLRTSAVFGLNARISGLIRSSCSTASADCRIRRALIVSNSGSPGPAPTRKTLPFMDDLAGSVFVHLAPRLPSFERLPVGCRVEQLSPKFWINRAGKQIFPGFSEFVEPARIDRCQLRFELATQPLCKGRAVSSRRDRNLQVTAPNDRGIIKITPLGIVHDVAKSLAVLCFTVDRIINFDGGSRAHNQEDRVQIVSLESAGFPIQHASTRPRGHSRRSPWRDDTNLGVGNQQAANLGFADLARSHHQAMPIFEFQKHWE